MKSLKLSFLVLALSAAGAVFAHGEKDHSKAQSEPNVDANGLAVYGAAMPEGAAVPIVQAVDHPEQFAAGEHKISGRISKVCQAGGCWMTLSDGEKSARVMFADHAFVIPKDSQGEAEVFGTVTVKVIEEATAKHLAEDEGKDPSKVTGDSQEVRITATSVALRAQS